FYCLSPDTEIGSWVAKRIKYLELYQEVKSAMSKRTTCRSCGELIPTKLENYLGVVPNICHTCLTAAIRELHKDEGRYYGLEHEIDV
ncbi:MAG: hypothetical protein WA461_09375, partial [Nitrososphaeraceae archaeon]